MDSADPKADPFGHILTRESPLEQPSGAEATLFKSILYYCVLVLGGPLVAFFVTKHLLLSSILQWDAEEIRTNVVSAVAAVIVLHLALGLFIMKAYLGDDDTKKKIGKRD